MATLSETKPEATAVADIVHYGEKLVLPSGVTLKQAVDLIMRRMKYEEEVTRVHSKFDLFPWDGAVLLDNVLKQRYGWSQAVAVESMFGKELPTLMTVETAPGVFQPVPWGRFSLPNVEGWIHTHHVHEGALWKFAITAEIKRRDERVIKDLFEEVRRRAMTESIYRGKAVKCDFLDKDGAAQTPTPKFMDVSQVDPDMLVLSDKLERAVETNLFTPITRVQDILDNGIPVKRGVLLGGTYGTGKTLIAHVASRKAVDSGITFVYIQKAAELTYAIAFAKQYQSPACVVFCEDIDREVSGERTEDMDAVLNTIDGIDSKTSNIIVVLTTNNIQAIHPAMLRPGRLDAVIDVTPPDAKAITRLIKVYAKGALEDNVDLTEVGEVLAGNIPAVIAEVVKRAKLAQLSLQEPGTWVDKLSAQALLDSAMTIQAQVELLKPKEVDKGHTLDSALRAAVLDSFNGSREKIDHTHKLSKAIAAKVGL